MGIFPALLDTKDTTDFPGSTPDLGLYLCKDLFSCRRNDRLCDNFDIVNYPYLESNISKDPSYCYSSPCSIYHILRVFLKVLVNVAIEATTAKLLQMH